MEICKDFYRFLKIYGSFPKIQLYFWVKISQYGVGIHLISFVSYCVGGLMSYL